MILSRFLALSSVVAFLSFGIHPADAQAAGRTMRTPQEIYQLLSSIPARGDILGRVMFHLGMEAAYITTSGASSEDIDGSGSVMRKGDRIIDIYLKHSPPANAGCPIRQPVSLIQRGGAYLPTNRASNFLLTGVCAVPA